MYVIFGATGNTGRVVVEKLLQAGKTVRAMGRDVDKLKPLTERGAEAFAGSLEDAGAVTRALEGADAAYVMIPGKPQEPDPTAYDNRVIDNTAKGIERAGVKHVLLVSSVGAERGAGTGPVAGLHRMEERLNRISGVNLLHLRPNYFMENTLTTLGLIRHMGINGGLLTPGTALPMIATKDIGAFAAERLLRLDFSGTSYRDMTGPEDITMPQVTQVIGRHMGRPDLPYIVFGDEDVVGALTGMGMSEAVSRRYVEMWHAINAGEMRPTQQPPDRVVCPTTYEQFAQEHAAVIGS